MYRFLYKSYRLFFFGSPLMLKMAEESQVRVIKSGFLGPWFQAGGHSLGSAAVYTPHQDQ